jgi:hypothetical protein
MAVAAEMELPWSSAILGMWVLMIAKSSSNWLAPEQQASYTA